MEAMRLLCEVQSAQLTKPGDVTSMRFYFAFFGLAERYRDVTPTPLLLLETT
jgi:hypothetical protein